MFKFRSKKQSTIYNLQSTTRGFTLIELLVVIVIIGILSALITVNFIGIRQRGRDAQRKSDLIQIQSALELYRADNGSYPLTFPVCPDQFAGTGATPPIYMRKIPCDPLQPASLVSYTYSSDGTTYTTYACLENNNDPQKDTGSDVKASCTNSNFASYTLLNP